MPAIIIKHFNHINDEEKNTLSKTPLLASSALGIPCYAQISSMSSGPVTVAVKEITNEARNTWWWSPSVSRQLTNMLANELKSTGHFTIVERQGLKKC